jgi:hypothetical protein
MYTYNSTLYIHIIVRYITLRYSELPSFMDPDGLLLCSQEPTTRKSTEPD